jgi:hypothetical protein
MISNRLVAWIRDRKADFRQAMTAARSEPSPTSSPEWYAGLVVSPASFSRQLGDMQLSLMRANESRANDHQNDHQTAHHQTPGSSQENDPVAVSQQRI